MPSDTSDLFPANKNLDNSGTALDIACGMGRNTHFLVDNGFLVDAVDLSDYALSKVREHENINKIETDLDTYQLETDMYDLIVKINYLERNLFPQIIKALKKTVFSSMRPLSKEKARVKGIIHLPTLPFY